MLAIAAEKAEVPLPSISPVSVPTPVPPCATVTSALLVRIVAEALGKVYVFADVAGPDTVKNALLVPPFATGRMPVTPAVSGRPVALVSTRALGVPSAGVTNVGEFASTGLPVPVAVTPWIVVDVTHSATCPLVGVPELDTLPPAAMVLQPNPVPLVQISALVAPEHDGSARPEGVVAVSAPRTVLAVCDARFEFGRLPEKAFAVTVPEPVGPRLAPVPTDMAAVVFVPVVMALKAEDPPVMVLHPKPVPEVQISAFVAPLQDGMVKPDGVVAVRAPSTWFAESTVRFAYGRFPVTPAPSGRPVAFVSTPDAGVPKAGVTNVGLVSVNPAMLVVVLPVAIEVEPMVMGKPFTPQLAAAHDPLTPTRHSPFTGAIPAGVEVVFEITTLPEAGQVTPPPLPLLQLPQEVV